MTATRLAGYADATEAAQQALVKLAEEVANLASPGLTAAELLELLRLILHRRVDDLIDVEALRHPSPRHVIARTSRYAELLAEVRAR